jgi:hypothetical protein
MALALRRNGGEVVDDGAPPPNSDGKDEREVLREFERACGSMARPERLRTIR